MEETPVVSSEKKGGMNMVLMVAAIAVVLIGGFMLLNKPANQSSTETTPINDTMAPTGSSDTDNESTNGESMVGDVVTVDMEAGSFYYTPKEIRVKKGQTVRINLTAKDMMHDLNIDELSVKSAIVKAGESTVVEFTASEVGSFEYYCSVGQHRANGQVGTLIVTE